jgi:hypothetical protein
MPLDWKPSEEFRKSQFVKPWQQVAESEMFKQAMGAAMMQTLFDLPKPPDMGNAAANEYRRQGATMVLFRLMNLCSVSEPIKERDVSAQNLKHDV